ncbi:hypothetical protein EG68_00528 [Paragonimus skrjabini miyazakii]|uniref:Uncharacterized protein n=1 Tax=Paragonimus skrjabini miyazakii TaxID=59628 RepID=A0A8S9Z8X6_9TREM|nr:hypothetical protein EG68_00528 [Paragonimus skrjabini miyazakii]
MSQLANSIDITVKYKHLKSPAVPSCLSICGDEILARVRNGQLRMVPSCWSSVVQNASHLRDNRIDDVQDLLDTLSVEKRQATVSRDEFHRMPEYMVIPTHKIFAALWEFLNQCQQSLCTRLTYPAAGWIIMGPAYSDNFDNVHDAHYVKEVRQFVESLRDHAPIRKDMLCYIMSMLTEIVHDVVDHCRDEPAWASLVRYHIAHQFGPILFKLQCEKCKVTVTEQARTCDYCTVITHFLQKPFLADVMDRLLRHTSFEFWKNAMTMNSQRAGNATTATTVDTEQIHLDVMNFLVRQKTKAKNPLPMTRPRPSLIAFQSTQSALSATQSSREMSLSSPAFDASMLEQHKIQDSKPELNGKRDVNEEHWGKVGKSKSDKKSKRPPVYKRRVSTSRSRKLINHRSVSVKPEKKSHSKGGHSSRKQSGLKRRGTVR